MENQPEVFRPWSAVQVACQARHKKKKRGAGFVLMFSTGEIRGFSVRPVFDLSDSEQSQAKKGRPRWGVGRLSAVGFDHCIVRKRTGFRRHFPVALACAFSPRMGWPARASPRAHRPALDQRAKERKVLRTPSGSNGIPATRSAKVSPTAGCKAKIALNDFTPLPASTPPVPAVVAIF